MTFYSRKCCHISSPPYPWMEYSYGSQPFLLLGEKSIRSCCGVQQGDPLGPLGFSLVLHPMVQKIKEQVPGHIINAWYLDDGTLCGSPDDQARALAIIESDGPPGGLYLNKAKSLHFIPLGSSAFHPHLHGIPSTSNGFTLLGSPIGPITFCEASALDWIQATMSNLRELQDAQMEMALLQSCLSLPKLSFLLRSCPPAKITDVLNYFDNVMREGLSDLVGSPLSDWAWLKASLPSSSGGLGLRQATLHAPATYIGSVLQAQPLISDILGHSFSHPPYFNATLTLF